MNLPRRDYPVEASQKLHLHYTEPGQTGVTRVSKPAGAIMYSSVYSHCPLTQKPKDTYFKYSNICSDFKQAMSVTQTDP